MPDKYYSRLYSTRIQHIHPLLPPTEMVKKLPVTDVAFQTVSVSRKSIEALLDRRDDRFLLIIGPCSIHDTEAALEYARRLNVLRKKYEDIFFIVMRTYFEKPRTGLGWRGLLVEPDLDGIINIEGGMRKARSLLLAVTELGLPAATEFLDPIASQYTGDLISWASIGARSSESQIHRELASGLAMPVGFKNGTKGEIEPAVNGILSARRPHAFLGITEHGDSAVIHTTGNEYAHLVLRGGTESVNYDRGSVENSCRLLDEQGLPSSLLIDCSHGNSQKQPLKQKEVLLHSLKLRYAEPCLEEIRGCMLESFIKGGVSAVSECCSIGHYGQSITDPCLNWEMTEELLAEAAAFCRNCR